ncbi:UDP-N-acetylmuramate dehydrogenase [Helicobacter suis]|uniref:UDP-N-acetylmuramate dehydrogenase n=1 Tax=Helicobacter suis TaxID=104628 RepID=UPI00249025A1|nr:UDP-N-acetylmuramate dehydrogenase [Helicobacter suis]
MEVIDFSRYSSVKIGSKVKVRVIKQCGDYAGLFIIGLANNLLVSSSAKNLAMLDTCFDYIVDCGSYIEVGARTSAQKLFGYFRDHNLYGLEFLGALPGSVGGLVKMNAGMKTYEFKDILLEANINGKWLVVEDLHLTYRSSQIVGVIFKVRLKKIPGFRIEVLKACMIMRKNHPKKPSFGSCFKNPPGDFAGRLLEMAGLRGFNLEHVGFASTHANFLINLGGAHFEEAIKLIALAKERVLNAFGIILEEEVCIVGL